LHNTEVDGAYPHKDHIDTALSTASVGVNAIAQAQQVKLSGKSIAVGNTKFTMSSHAPK
jgi:hypothetical protein